MEKKTVYYFKNLQTFLNNKNSLPKQSFSLIEETGQFYVNGQFFSENTLFNLNQLLENVTGELSEKDTTNEAVIKLYKLIQEVNQDANNLIKLLVSEIYDLRETTNERMDKTDKIVASGLSQHNDEIDKLKTTTEELKSSTDSLSVKVEDHLDNKDLQHIPDGGHERQILAWQADGKAKWDDLANMFTGLEELLAYGVEWDVNVADPHLTRIGNMSLHNTLPIQSQLKGCIAQKDKVIYWLDENDWRFRKDATTIAVDLTENTETFAVPSIVGLGINQWLRSGDNLAKITDINTEASTITVEWSLPTVEEGQDPIDLTTITSLEVGSRLDGYDGTVRVYCPSFYIKSKIIGDKRQVWLSTVKIDNTWVYQPEILIDAYRCTVLRQVPENMGYLSTLPANSAISVVNTNAYCRGLSNQSNLDANLAENPFNTALGKPAVGTSRSNMRINCRNAGNEMLSYEQYKNIFYWLWVVEYANFNSQEEFKSTLTQEGYHQGGMGPGVTEMKAEANVGYGLIPCGYMNEFGNHTGIKEAKFSNNKTVKVPRWRGFENPFGDIQTSLDGCIHNNYIFYVINDPQNYTDSMTDIASKADRAIEECHSGYHHYKEFNIGDSADIVPLEESGSGSNTTYKCDKHWTDPGGPHTLFVGGHSYDGGGAGLGYFDSMRGVSYNFTGVGFRSVSSFLSFQTVEQE